MSFQPTFRSSSCCPQVPPCKQDENKCPSTPTEISVKNDKIVCPPEPDDCSSETKPFCEASCQSSESTMKAADTCTSTDPCQDDPCQDDPCQIDPCQDDPCQASIDINRLACLSGPAGTDPYDGLLVLRGADKRRHFETATVPEEDFVDLSCTTGVPEKELNSRTVFIYKSFKNVMQQGTDNTKVWEIRWDTQERWENPLMGWASTADPLSNVTIEFGSQQEAERYCTRNGWKYIIMPLRESTPMPPKKYSDNFSWNRRHRVSTK